MGKATTTKTKQKNNNMFKLLWLRIKKQKSSWGKQQKTTKKKNKKKQAKMFKLVWPWAPSQTSLNFVVLLVFLFVVLFSHVLFAFDYEPE